MPPPQYTNRPSGRSVTVESHGKGKKSYTTVLAIIGFSIGILGGYHLIGSPHKGSQLRRSTIEDSHSFHGGDIHSAASHKAAKSSPPPPPARRAGTPDVIVVAAPPPHVLVGDLDERHPKNKAAILAGQSSHDEHKSDTLAAMQHQQSDVSENAGGHGKGAGKTTTTSTASAASAKVNAGSKKKGAKAAAADILAATGHEVSPPPAAGANKTSTPAAVLSTATTNTTSGAVVTKATTTAANKGPNVSGNQPQAPAVLQSPTATTANSKATTAVATAAAATVGGTAGNAAVHGNASNILTSEQLHDGKVQPEDHAVAVHMTGGMPTAQTTGTNAAAASSTNATAASSATAGAAAGSGASAGTGAAATRPKGDTIHTLFTSNGSPYQNFQARIMVGTYNIVRKQPGGEHMVALTRILHRTKMDGFEIEIPTFRADPLQPECDKWCWFPVADRANAVKQWIAAADQDPSLVKGAWLLLLESDYVWIKPMPVPGDAWDPKVPGRSFAFDYISAQHPIVREILKERCPDCDPKTVPNSGPAPVLLRFDDLKKATPVWEELTTWIETHEHAKKQLGWVREMYAWDIAVAQFKINLLNQGVTTTCLITQPPHDHSAYNSSMYHYTWGSIWSQNGKEIWKWDKRFYTDPKDALKVPLLTLPPEVTDNSVTQHDGVTIDKALRDTMADMLSHMNEAIKTLPDLTDKITAS